MAFKMHIENSALEGKDVIPAGIYMVRFIDFKPKYSARKPTDAEGARTSLNLNAKMEIIDNPEYIGRFVYEGLNEKAAWITVDFVHAFGFPMETDGKTTWMPGEWDGTDGDAASYVYKGPLTGQVAQIEIVVDSYNNKANNKVSRYFCKVQDCAVKFPKITHSTNLISKKS